MNAKKTEDQSSKTTDVNPTQDGAGFSVVDKRVSAQPNGADGNSEASELPIEIDPAQHMLLQYNFEALQTELEAKRLRVNELAKGVQEIEARQKATLVRLEREMERAVSRTKGQLLDKLLHVLDGFQHSLDSIPVNEHTKPIMAGVHMIHRQFLTQLSELGLMQFAPLGETFDPERHEAVQKIVVTEPAKDGIVLQVVRAGYVHEGRVLRAAQVAVGDCEVQAEEEPSEPGSEDVEPAQTEG